jgi:hypothetical protein
MSVERWHTCNEEQSNINEINENVIVMKHVKCVLCRCDAASYFFLNSEIFSGFSECPLLRSILH